MKRFAVTLFGSSLTAIYWWIAFTVVYADVLFVGDRSPSRQSIPDHDALLRSGTIIVGAVLIYAALVVIWQRVSAKLKSSISRT